MKLIKSLFLIIVLIFSIGFFAFSDFNMPSINNDQKHISTPSSSTQKEPVTLPNIKLSFVAVGDNLIHGAVYKDAFIGNNSYDFKPCYENIKKYIDGKDIAFINQETVIGGKEMGLSHYPLFNSPEEIVEAINDTGFNLVNTASNHSLDKGEKGIINALNTFDQYQRLIVSGTNRSNEEQQKLRILEKQGLKIGFLAYTQNTNGISNKNAYLVNYINEENIKKDVTYAKENCDIIIVSMHWGTENSNYVNDYQMKYTKLLNELGVNIIIGTHPHVIQKVEFYKGENGFETLVMYSLGNFLSAQDVANNLVEGMVLSDIIYNQNTKEITYENTTFVPLVDYFTKGYVNFTIYPLSDYTPTLASKHGLKLSIDYCIKKVKEIITDEKIKILY